MPLHRLINDFSGGELSPLIEHRVDLEQQPKGCRVLENFLPSIRGGVFRRPGLEYIGQCRSEAIDYNNPGGSSYSDFSDPRLIPFVVSPDDDGRYLLELNNYSLRVWKKDDATFANHPNWGTETLNAYVFSWRYVSSGGGTGDFDQYAPWSEDEIFDIQVIQVNNVMYLLHPNHMPYVLIRKAGIDVTLNTPYWLFYLYPITYDPSNLYDPYSLGLSYPSLPYVAYNRLPYIANANTSYTFTLSSGTVGTGRTLTMSADTFFKNADGDWSDWIRTSGTADLDYNEGMFLSLHNGYAVITGVTSKTVATVQILSTVSTTGGSSTWGLCAWGRPVGCPRAAAFFQQRLWFGGTKELPTTIWGSESGDFNDFKPNTGDSDPLQFTIASSNQSEIQALVGEQELMVLTQTETWRASGGGAAITPTNIQVYKHSGNGCAYFQPVMTSDSWVYVGHGGQDIRALSFSEESQSYRSAIVSFFCEHFFRTTITDIAWQQHPEPTLWVVSNRQLYSITYDGNLGIAAAAYHPMSATAGASSFITSVAVLPSSEGTKYSNVETDQVFVTVWRYNTSNDSNYYIERMDPNWMRNLYFSSTYGDDMIYLDSAVWQTGSAATSWSAIAPHLIGESVAILADGVPVLDANGDLDLVTVGTGGDVDFPSGVAAATTVVVGLPYTSTLQPSRTELDMRDGTAQSRKMLTRRIEVETWKSLGLQYSDRTDGTFRSVSGDTADAAGSLLTEKKKKVSAGRHRDNVDVTLKSEFPLPANVLALITKFEPYGD